MALPDRLSARLAAYGFWRLKGLRRLQAPYEALKGLIGPLRAL